MSKTITEKFRGNRARPIGKESPTQQRRRERLFSALNHELRQAGDFGQVRTVVVYNTTTNLLSCSGYPIADVKLFSVLNLNTKTTIKRPPAYTLNFRLCKRGCLIRLDNFEPCADNLWVAIVGIPIGGDETREVLPYPRRTVIG